MKVYAVDKPFHARIIIACDEPDPTIAALYQVIDHLPHPVETIKGNLIDLWVNRSGHNTQWPYIRLKILQNPLAAWCAQENHAAYRPGLKQLACPRQRVNLRVGGNVSDPIAEFLKPSICTFKDGVKKRVTVPGGLRHKQNTNLFLFLLALVANRLCSTVPPKYQPFFRQLAQITAHRHLGNVKVLCQLARAEKLVLVGLFDQMNNALLALFFIHFFGHFEIRGVVASSIRQESIETQ